METKFTAPPWKANRFSEYGDFHVFSDDHGTIAQVTCPGGEFREMNEANARLIAASPALYEALQAVADDEMWMDLTRSSKDKVEAALRLATEGGETP